MATMLHNIGHNNNNNKFFINRGLHSQLITNLPRDPHQHFKIYTVKYSIYKSYTQEGKHCSKYTQKDVINI